MKDKLLTLILAGCLALTACQPDLRFEPDFCYSETAEITLGESDVSLVFPADSSTATLTFETSTDWTATFVDERAKDWCSIPFEEGHDGTYAMRVSVTSNEVPEERSTSIILTCKKVQRTIVVLQQRRNILRLEPDSVSIPCVGGRFRIAVTSNLDFSVRMGGDGSWLRLVGTKDLVTSEPLFEVDENPGKEAREGLILFECIGAALTDTVVVTQSGQMPGFSFNTAQREAKAPVLDAAASDAWIYWGDGSVERYAAGLTHSYAEAGWHTIRVEGCSMAPLMIAEPEDGMKIDFSGLNNREETR